MIKNSINTMSRRANHSHIEDDEDDKNIHELSSKVRLLKEVSIQIGEETREHNRYLKQLDSKADSIWGSLSLNMDHVKKLSRGGHNNIVFYLIAFVAFVMIVIYLINKSL